MVGPKHITNKLLMALKAPIPKTNDRKFDWYDNRGPNFIFTKLCSIFQFHDLLKRMGYTHSIK